MQTLHTASTPHNIETPGEAREWFVAFEYPFHLVNPLNLRGAQLHRSHSARRVRLEREGAYYAWFAAGKPRPPTLPVIVTLIRNSPCSFDDGDNIAAAFKAVRDELARAIGLKGDAKGSGAVWLYEQRRSKQHIVRVEMRAAMRGVHG